MGPLFSIALLGAIAMVAMAISFGVAKIFLPLKPAALVAMLFVVFSAIGCFVGLFGQAIWLPPTLESSEAVISYLGISAAIGLSSGVTAVWLFMAWRRARNIRT